ncbi:hypothetical protein MNBD_CHLOROFLEXI01-62 [hydrothermal vent metagenome]|uniref:Cadherin domain-containing protein n=1 Tax=hydrothermal vent metagenome TaxID=652676 RepID=A0A3B0VK68_9ZZZZ
MRRNRIPVVFAILLSMSVVVFWLGTVLADATIEINDGLTVAEGSVDNIISSTVLSATDGITGSPTAILTYTLVTTPTNGFLTLNGSPSLAVNDQFTQTAVNNNWLLYTHDDSEMLSDSFDFTVETSTTITNSTFLITITPVYDQIPVVDDQTFSVDENSVTGTAVDTIIATDLDAADALTYTIIGGNFGTPFAVGNITGNITVDSIAPLDFETNQFLTFTVQVEDLGVLTDTAVITVNLNDINEAPTISGGPFTITENVANGLFVGTVITSDVDVGDTFTYTITASDPAAAFAIGSSSGTITVSDSSLLDFETTPTFTLTVQIEDSGTLTDTADIVITLLDANDPPVLSAAGPFPLPENSPNGTLVGSAIIATDDDIGAGDVLTYTIAAGDPSSIFAIGGSSGQITVTNGSLLDFDTLPTSYNLTIQVIDNAGATDIEIVTINLTNVNEPPTISGGPFMLNENTANGISVGTVITSDVDAGDTFTYSITASDPAAAFAIGSSSGTITVSDSSLLDFETTPTFTLTVQIEDSGALTDTADIVINLDNANEIPTVNGNTFNIDENSANGTAVGTVSGSDPDAADMGNLTFGILSGNTAGAFAIANDGSNNGNITVANIIQLDFETNQSFTLGIIVTDMGGLNSTANVTININNLFDEAPTASNATFFAAEGSANGVVVGTVSATDPELASGDALTYAITSGNMGSVFAINSSSGQITVPDVSKLDSNSMPIFNLTVTVTDLGNLVDTAVITINVSPLPINTLYLPIILNNYPPIEPNNNCNQSFGIGTGTDYEFTADDTEDWYAVTLSSPGNLLVTLSSFEPAQGQLIVYAGPCSSLTALQNDGSSSTTKVVNLTGLAAGTYYIRVFSAPITNTTYTLRVN